MRKVLRGIAAAAILSLSSAVLVAAEDIPFIPLQISFTPMVAVPFGYGDVGLELGAVGALTRDVEGGAFSGVFTISRAVHGVQGNGVFGIASADVSGLQGAGVFNLAGGDVEGAQLAGVFDIAGGSVQGAQLAGVFTIAGDVEGAQAAGVFAMAGRYRGPIQTAGVFTVATSIHGSQIAGVGNFAGEVRGAQISSIVNTADRIQGVQLGLINVANHLEGIQLGLVNIARNGIGGVGYLFDPVTDYGWFFWQNGSPFLYSRVAAGRPLASAWGSPAGTIASAGLGSRAYLGYERRRSPWLDLEVSADWYLGPALVSLRDDMQAIRDAGGAPCLFGDPAVEAAFSRAGALLPAQPWPSVSLTLGLPVFWRLEALVGVRSDIDIAAFPAMPATYRSGLDSGTVSLFGTDFRAYSKWFFGFRI